MHSAEASALLEKGLTALKRGQSYLAMTCLERAMEIQDSPRLRSFLAYCHALNGRNIDRAVEMARSVLSDAPDNPEYCLNLGRILVLAGRKAEAITVFRQGLTDSSNIELIEQLEQLGRRRPPLFGNLPRSNPLNKYGGKVLHMMGLR